MWGAGLMGLMEVLAQHLLLLSESSSHSGGGCEGFEEEGSVNCRG